MSKRAAYRLIARAKEQLYIGEMTQDEYNLVAETLKALIKGGN
ncbi:hypothetical protein [Bacillus toyonensis]|nr:hypothetical protein [Bacillus toyonensis]